ncbi:HTH domain-containing protein [Amycolatopsis sp. H6(2020)]|nr:HTH domain-containing protein [Amycolatopsis sp. H6(2020)]
MPASPRLVGSGRHPGMTQLHQAVPLVERQHALIEEMRARAPRFVPGRVLAERTGTTVRTVERDVTRMRAAGIPVEVKRGTGGGYRLAMLSRVPPLTFSPGEVAALVASLVALGPYTSATACSALEKLVTAFPVPATRAPH